MQNTTSTIVATFIATVLLFVAPLVTYTNRNDNVTQESVKLIIDEFVTEIKNTGKLSNTAYQNLQSRLAATGNTYDVEMEIHTLDENPGKKTSQANYTKIGENVYYVEYTTQILNKLGVTGEVNTTSNDIILKEGDLIYVSAKNANNTVAQTLKRSFFSYSNEEEYVISASSSGMVTVNGN